MAVSCRGGESLTPQPVDQFGEGEFIVRSGAVERLEHHRRANANDTVKLFSPPERRTLTGFWIGSMTNVKSGPRRKKRGRPGSPRMALAEVGIVIFLLGLLSNEDSK